MVSARCSVQLEKHLAPLAARPASTLPGRRHAHLTSPGQSVSTTVRPSAARSVLRNVACRRPAAHGAAGVGAGCGGACARVVHAEAQSTSTRGQRRAARAQGRMAGATAGRKRCAQRFHTRGIDWCNLQWRREAQLTYTRAPRATACLRRPPRRAGGRLPEQGVAAAAPDGRLSPAGRRSSGARVARGLPARRCSCPRLLLQAAAR